MKHSNLINGYDSLNLTKLDVLDDLEEIRIGIKYVVEGKELPGFPGKYKLPLRLRSHFETLLFFEANLEILDKVQVQYVTFPGWKSSIASITSYKDLPQNCKEYVEYIERFLKVPVRWIGVGPERESMITK